jgi:hypothetical protein
MMLQQVPIIGTGEITVAVMVAFLTFLVVEVVKISKRMEKSDTTWLEIMREYISAIRSTPQAQPYQSYNDQTGLTPPQVVAQQAPQEAPRRRLYDEDAAVDVTPQKKAAEEPPPFPYAVDVYGRVLTCPKCRMERGETRPLMILHRDESGYTLTCGRLDAQGRLHMFRLQDVSNSVSPIIEMNAVRELVAEDVKRRGERRGAERKKVKKEEDGEGLEKEEAE